jgi:ankyrin repeat protein
MGTEGNNRINELMVACSRGELSRAEELVEAGADVNARDAFGNTALIYAAGGGHQALVEMLLSCGADVGVKNNNGLTCLDLAAARGHSAVAALLRHARFFHAARDGDARLLSQLLDAGADVNAQHTDGWTALMTAALYDRPEVASVLLRRGADAALENDAGWTALLIAERKGHARVAALLRRGPFEQRGAVEPPRRAPESPRGGLPPAELPPIEVSLDPIDEIRVDSEDLKPMIEMPDHPDA